MKNKIKWFAVISAMVMSFVFAGCQVESDSHEHSFSKEWTSDETSHWHAATCEHTEEVSDKAEHTFGEWKTTLEPTEEADGKKERTCTVCSYKEEQSIAKLEHTHTFAETWTSDEANHWHVATCEHTEEVSDKAEHTFGEWKTTLEPTEEADGKKERTCTVCSYKEEQSIAKLEHTHTFAETWTSDEANHWHVATCEHTEEVSDKAEHTFGEWEVTKNATCTEKGSRECTCTVCKYEETEEIAATGHSYSLEWSKDLTNHWHAATCEHTEEVSEKTAHTFGEWKTTVEETEEAEGKKERTCTVCSYNEKKIISKISKGFVKVTGTTITGDETWTPSSYVFVSGRSLTIPDLIVCDHEVTRGEYKEVVGSDPSTASAYDKDGNKLTGDAVFNNPVNYVNWYDALVYCNKLSIKESLKPCYTISGSTDPDTWGTVPTSSNSTWDAAVCDFEADGYRLPTEAEWEWLARGGENYTYAGSNTVEDVAWYKSNTSETGTREVKTKQANGYRLYDMSGNVWEWCWDWYGSVSISTAAAGAASGSYRVQRGGCRYGSNSCWVAGRYIYNPYDRNDNYGFRVVRSAN